MGGWLEMVEKNLGKKLLAEGKVDEAIAWYEEAIKLMPENPEDYEWLGAALEVKGNLSAAVTNYEKALTLYPKTHPSYNWCCFKLGQFLARLGQADEAISYYHQAIDLEPGKGEYHEWLGGALEIKGDLEGAIASYEKALELYPENHPSLNWCYYKLAQFYSQLSWLNKAIDAYKKLLRFNPNDKKAERELKRLIVRSDYQERSKLISLTPESLKIVEKSLVDNLYSHCKTTELTKSTFKEDCNFNLFKRYEDTCNFVIPWVEKRIHLSECKTMVEIGCGTGSSTAAFAQMVQNLAAYEIDGKSLEVARVRLEAMGIENANLVKVNPDNLWKSIQRDYQQVDSVLLFAVVEHLTISERLETIKNSWDLLKPGGYLIIVETPNRLAYYDSYTSHLDFFHLLPDELMLKYIDESPRKGFVNSIKQQLERSELEAKTSLYRRGQGVSYHEFELALGEDIDRLIIADGFEEEIIDWFGFTISDRLLQHYWIEKKIEKFIGFTRSVINLILRKPGGESEGLKTKIHKDDYVQSMIHTYGLDRRLERFF